MIASAVNAAPIPSLPPGSYLRLPAADVSAFIRQIVVDPLLVTRYARVFHVTPSAAREALTKLHTAKLPKDRIMRVYYVHNGEKLGFKVRRVRRGTPVYALADGTPLLMRVCGNPLRASGPYDPQITDIRSFNAHEPMTKPAHTSTAIFDTEGPLNTTGTNADRDDPTMTGFIPDITVYQAPPMRDAPGSVTHPREALARWFASPPTVYTMPGDGPYTGTTTPSSGEGGNGGQPGGDEGGSSSDDGTVVTPSGDPETPPAQTPEPGAFAFAVSAIAAVVSLRRRA